MITKLNKILLFLAVFSMFNPDLIVLLSDYRIQHGLWLCAYTLGVAEYVTTILYKKAVYHSSYSTLLETIE